VQTQPAAAEANRLQVYASRHVSRSALLIFSDGIAPGPLDEHRHVHNVVVRSYYVARDSVGQRNVPALRVKSLTRSGTSLVFDDEEVMPGIEDLQVQFGIAAVGDFSGRATRYVDPGHADVPLSQVVSVRLWVRIRSDEAEPLFQDTRTYTYAGIVYMPAGGERHFRRAVMARTLTLRNARLS
jgi:hypothetical protein